MLDKLFALGTTFAIVTGVGIALRPGAPTANVVKALTSGFAGIEKGAYGPAR